MEIYSISGAYWTDSGGIFVGSLCAVGMFLVAYNGSSGKLDQESILAKFAGVFAFIVALFPTASKVKEIRLEEAYGTCTEPPCVVEFLHQSPGWTESVAGFFGVTTVTIHYVFAGLLFGILTYLMTFFAARAKRKNKMGRARAYWFLALLMILGIVAGPVMYLLGLVDDSSKLVLQLEWWLLWCFGVGWILAGTYKVEAEGAHQ